MKKKMNVCTVKGMVGPKSWYTSPWKFKTWRVREGGTNCTWRALRSSDPSFSPLGASVSSRPSGNRSWSAPQNRHKGASRPPSKLLTSGASSSFGCQEFQTLIVCERDTRGEDKQRDPPVAHSDLLHDSSSRGHSNLIIPKTYTKEIYMQVVNGYRMSPMLDERTNILPSVCQRVLSGVVNERVSKKC